MTYILDQPESDRREPGYTRALIYGIPIAGVFFFVIGLIFKVQHWPLAKLLIYLGAGLALGSLSGIYLGARRLVMAAVSILVLIVVWVMLEFSFPNNLVVSVIYFLSALLSVIVEYRMVAGIRKLRQ